MPFPLSKLADVARDQEHLRGAADLLDRYPTALDGQHPIRRWEYSMALRAIAAWQRRREAYNPHLDIADVGGAGSGFWQALAAHTTAGVDVIDRLAPPAGDSPDTRRVRFWQEDLETLLNAGWVRAHDFDAVVCISVIEHVRMPLVFLRACRALLRPGGLLFLTTDCASEERPDTFHFHWMRERIYTPGARQALLRGARDLGLEPFGASDWETDPGPQLYDYTVGSFAWIKEA